MVNYQISNFKNLLSPLRYPGPKSGLVDYIKQILEINSLNPCLYIEPFFGGGSVAINLLNKNLDDRAENPVRARDIGRLEFDSQYYQALIKAPKPYRAKLVEILKGD